MKTQRFMHAPERSVNIKILDALNCLLNLWHKLCRCGDTAAQWLTHVIMSSSSLAGGEISGCDGIASWLQIKLLGKLFDRLHFNSSV